MTNQSERIQNLEKDHLVMKEKVATIRKELIENDKSTLALNDKVVLINNRIASWDGGLTLANKAVFLLAAIVGAVIAIIKYTS